ncbi:hypothetical protein B0H14DRAFT_3500397 [Mycena olivaceomarginata]|nr:hypothetical protein B0H14DRAFT_3500397 [Mycena olivaceomarginata]
MSPSHFTTIYKSFNEGTSITVYGTVAPINPPESSLTFVVDDTFTSTFTPPGDLAANVYHDALWTSPTLNNGSHTLVITQTTAQAVGVIFLDYLMYNSTSQWVVGPYFLDDRDARIQYTPAWRKFPSDLDFDNTSQASTSAGDSFSLQFEGQGISFYGDLNNNGSVSFNASIVIDGRPPLYFTPPIQSEAVTTNNLIYDSGGLSDGNHTLVVTAQNDQAVWVDYFLITTTSAS